MPDLGPPSLDTERCTGCGQCVEDCASMVLAMDAPAPGAKAGRARLEHPDWCNACGHCEAICSVDAIHSPMPIPAGAPRPAKAPAVDPDSLELLLRERRSVRSYKPDPVPRALLERVVKVARYTPTGTNSQNVHWLVLDSREQVHELQQRCVRFYARLFGLVNNPVGRLGVRVVAGAKQRAQLQEYLPVVQEANRRMAQGDDRLLYDAPALVLVHAEAWDSCSPFNCDAALFSASLMAHSLGLGCCFNGFVQQAVENSRPLKKWLGIPRDHRCYMTMGLGWPALRHRKLCERQEPTLRWMEPE
jgi:nitroreductase/NAD-dependent dihydropyrimidine dehydrogenase PreA subunit